MTKTIILGSICIAMLIVSLVILFYTQYKLSTYAKTEDDEDDDENDEEINIVLARVFSLNPNNHLLWNNHLLGNNYWATGEDETFDDTIWNVLISLDGDVYVKNCAPGKHGWEHFDPDGNDCGMISNIEVKALKSQKRIGFPIAYETDENGQNLAVTLDI